MADLPRAKPVAVRIRRTLRQPPFGSVAGYMAGWRYPTHTHKPTMLIHETREAALEEARRTLAEAAKPLGA